MAFNLKQKQREMLRKRLFIATPFLGDGFDFFGFLETDHKISLLMISLAVLAFVYVILFLKKLYQSFPKATKYLFILSVVFLGSWQIGKTIENKLGYDNSTNKKSSETIVLGEEDENQFVPSGADNKDAAIGKADSAQLILDSDFQKIKTLFSKYELELDAKGNLRGALNLINNRLKLKTGSVNSRTIKDGSIQDKDIDSNINLHVKQLITKDDIEVGGLAVFRKGIQLSGGEFLVNGGIDVGDITADTFNGNVITTGSGTLTLNTHTLSLSGDAQLDQSLLTTSSPEFTGLTLDNNLNLTGASPAIDSSSGALNINTTNNQAVTFGTGSVTIPNLVVTDSHSGTATLTINSNETTGTIFSITGNSLTSGTGILKSITANAGNGEVTTGQEIAIADATTGGGGFVGTRISVSGSGTGSGDKYLLDLDPGTNMQVVFDSSGAFRPTTSVSSNTNTIGSPSYYWKNGYFDQITANSLAGTVVSGATSSTTWTIGSNETGDTNKALIFQRNSGSGNATLEWYRGSNDLRYLSANYPFNAAYTVSDSSIGTGVNLFSGDLTNNTTTGTQRLLSLSNTGTGTTEHGVYVTNTGTAETAIEIDGTWTNGLIIGSSAGNVGIGTTSPSYKLEVSGTAGFSSTIYAPNIGTGTDDSVLVLNSSGNLVTDEIDSRVWGSTLLDGTGTANYVPYFSDSDSLEKRLTPVPIEESLTV